MEHIDANNVHNFTAKHNFCHEKTTYGDFDESNCLDYWKYSKVILNKLYEPALSALIVPASNTSVERDFSYGGLLLKSHRSSMS